MNKIVLSIIVACVGFVAACTPPGPPEPAPALTEYEITIPGDEVPAELARFSGVWSGKWGGNLDGRLAVLTVSPTGSVEAVYAFGELRDRFGAGQTEVTGQIADGVLTLETFGNGAVVTYQFDSAAALAGRYSRDGNITNGVFTKE